MACLLTALASLVVRFGVIGSHSLWEGKYSPDLYGWSSDGSGIGGDLAPEIEREIFDTLLSFWDSEWDFGFSDKSGGRCGWFWVSGFNWSSNKSRRSRLSSSSSSRKENSESLPLSGTYWIGIFLEMWYLWQWLNKRLARLEESFLFRIRVATASCCGRSSDLFLEWESKLHSTGHNNRWM